jgi:hypothetical protein
VRTAPWTPRVVAGYHVEAVGGCDRLALVRLDDHLAPPVHRRVADRQHRRGDEGGVVDEQHPAFQHRPDEGAVDELVGAVGPLGVLADEVADRGVAVAGHRDQVGEGRLDQARLAGAGRTGQQGGDSLGAQRAQRLDVGHAGQHARPVDLPARAGDRAGHGLRRGSLRRCRRGGRAGSRRRGGDWLGRRGGLRGDGGGCGGGRGVGLVPDGLAGEAAGLGPVGQGGQRVADRAGRGLWRSRRPCAGRGARRATRQPGGEAGRCRAGPWPGRE